MTDIDYNIIVPEVENQLKQSGKGVENLDLENTISEEMYLAPVLAKKNGVLTLCRVPVSLLKLKYSDLTLADIAALKQPAVEAAEIANTAASNANSKAQLAETATTNANLAKEAANLAAANANSKATEAGQAVGSTNEAVENANTAASNANSKAQLAETATTNANLAKEAAVLAAENANDKATEAETQADRAKEQADHPMFIGTDYYVYKWDAVAKSYKKTDVYLKGEGLDYNTMSPEEIANITGKSAFDVAKEEGFEGTVAEWLDSLKGADANLNDIGNVQVTFEEPEEVGYLMPEDTVSDMFGKISKWITEKISKLKALAFKDRIDWSTDIDNKPTDLVQDTSYVHTDNNFTTTEKNKLSGIEEGAQKNIPIIHKAITLLASGWVLAGGNYTYNEYNSAIVDGCDVWISLENNTRKVAQEADLLKPEFLEGRITFLASNLPDSDINITYSIKQ